MAESMIKALLKQGTCKVISSDKSLERLSYMKKEYNIDTTEDNAWLAENSDVIVIAVKPQDIETALDDIKPVVSGRHLVVSIAAGIRIDKISRILKTKRIIRVMPNTPCLVGEMAAGFAASNCVRRKDIEFVRQMLNSAGLSVYMDEAMLDAVTGLSGSGPAFMAYLLDCFTEAGIREGLQGKDSAELALQTMLGTARLLREKNISTKELITMVSSPGGTTIAGRKILENSDVREIIYKTVEAAAKRSRELGK